MDLQHKIRLLVRTMGPRLLEDSSEFRAAMDDYLEQDDMSSGEMNLLIDAVRLDAYAQLVHLLSSGAAPDAAIITAGDALSEKRGGDNPAGCRWACACLGFAANRIDETTLSRFPYTRSFPVPVTHAPPTAVTHIPGPVVGPVAETGPPFQQQATKRSWMWLFAVAAVLAVALGAAALALELDDDGTPPATAAPTTMPMATPTNDSTEPTEPADHHDDEGAAPGEVTTEYAVLGDFAAVIDPAICHPVSVLGGQAERLGCFDQEDNQEFDLYLTHYTDLAALQAARGRLPAELRCQMATGVFFGAVRNETVRMYWDSTEELVSARIQGAEHHLEDIHAAFESLGISIEPCELPEGSGSDHHHDE